MSTTTPRAAKTTAKRPDDQPFDFNLDVAGPPRDLSPFVFHWNGRRWTMLHLQDLDVWDLSTAIDKGQIATMIEAFRLALGKDWEEFRKNGLSQWKFKALWGAYRKHCGINADGTPIDGDDGI